MGVAWSNCTGRNNSWLGVISGRHVALQHATLICILFRVLKNAVSIGFRMADVVSNTPTVCIVDDDRDFRVLLANTSRKQGLNTIECVNGVDVVGALEGQPEPWLIFMDIHMDQRDGIEAIEDLRGLDRDIRLRFMTGGTATHALAANMIARARDLNVSETLYKPFSLDVFRSALSIDSD